MLLHVLMIDHLHRQKIYSASLQCHKSSSILNLKINDANIFNDEKILDRHIYSKY